LLDGIKPAQMARKKQPNKRKASEVTNNIPDQGDGFKTPGIGRRSGKISKISSIFAKQRFPPGLEAYRAQGFFRLSRAKT
jgi:hypothetical protein